MQIGVIGRRGCCVNGAGCDGSDKPWRDGRAAAVGGISVVRAHRTQPSAGRFHGFDEQIPRIPPTNRPIAREAGKAALVASGVGVNSGYYTITV